MSYILVYRKRANEYIKIKKKWELTSRDELKLAIKALIFYKNK